MSGIENQGSCGGCWAFATVWAIEGLHFIQNKTLYQQLIDCSSDFRNEGCNGGLIDDGFKYVCEWRLRRIKEYADVPSRNEIQLKAAVAQQPVAVGIQANQGSFMYYRLGLCCLFVPWTWVKARLGNYWLGGGGK